MADDVLYNKAAIIERCIIRRDQNVKELFLPPYSGVPSRDWRGDNQ